MKKVCFVFIASLLAVACSKEKAPSTTSPQSGKTVEASANGDVSKIRTQATLSFSGYTWNVTPTSTQSPGPNYWNGGNAYVDASGFLHLKVTKNTSNGHWECAQIASAQSFGYGTYQWQVEGQIDKLDKNLVFGLFDYSGVDGRDEIDIEYSRYGNSTYPNLNYVVFPAQGASQPTAAYSQEFSSPNGTYTTQRFTRSPGNVNLKTLFGFQNGDTNLYLSKTFSSPTYSISSVSMPILMNLWLIKGLAPTDGKNVEIIIHSFKFTPQ